MSATGSGETLHGCASCAFCVFVQKPFDVTMPCLAQETDELPTMNTHMLSNKTFQACHEKLRAANGNAAFVGHSTLTKRFVVGRNDSLFVNNCILSRVNVVGIQFEHSGTFEPLMAEGKYVHWAPPESLKLSGGIPAISAIISSALTQCYCVPWPRLLPG